MPRLTPEQLGNVPYQEGIPGTFGQRLSTDKITLKELTDFVAACYRNGVPEHATVSPRYAYLVAKWRHLS